MDKKTLRKDMIAKLGAFDPAYKAEQEAVLKTKIIEYIEKHDIQSVGIVLSMPHELDTDSIIAALTERGRAVYTPVCNYKDKGMDFCRFTSFEDVVTDEKNLRVPSDTSEVNNQPEMIVVPGLIYSETGFRIGYGGGFYDRFLKDYDGLKVSLLFDEQLGEVIKEDHDIPVDVLITTSRTIDAEAGRQSDGK